MKFYFISADTDSSPYTSTLDEAKRQAREAAANSYDDVDVQQVEVATDRANILRLLNVDGGTQVPIKVVYTAKAKRKR